MSRNRPVTRFAGRRDLTSGGWWNQAIETAPEGEAQMKSIRSFVLVSLLVLAVPTSAPAFLLHYTLGTAVGTFTYNIVPEPDPHWTLTVDGGETVYEGQALDSAKFSGELAL